MYLLQQWYVGDVWWCRIVLHCEVSDRLYRDYLRRKERAEARCVQQSSQERSSWVLDYVELTSSTKSISNIFFIIDILYIV